MTTDEEIDICQKSCDEYFQLSRELVKHEERMAAAEMGIREMQNLGDLYQRRLKEGGENSVGSMYYSVFKTRSVALICR
jgi:hypothetical protein